MRWTDLHSEMLASLSLRETETNKEIEDIKQKLDKAIKEKSTGSSQSNGTSGNSSRNVVVSLFVPKSNQVRHAISPLTLAYLINLNPDCAPIDIRRKKCFMVA